MQYDYFFIRETRQYVKVRFNDVLYIESARNYSKIYTRTTTHMVLVGMRRLLEALPPDQFCRIHRAWIISLDALTAFDHEIARVGEREIPIGESYRKELEKRVPIIQRDPHSQGINDFKFCPSSGSTY